MTEVDEQTAPATAALTFKGTPGPWIVETTPKFLWVGPSKAWARKVSNVVTTFEIGLHYTAEYNARKHADASLIAAAPDMLVACQSVIPPNLCTDNPNIPDSQIIPLDFTMGELRRIHAAIARALGSEGA